MSKDVEDLFKTELYEGESKVLSLEEAIERYVHPKMFLHVSTSRSPSSAVYEICRQFRDKKPQFEIICLGSSLQVQILAVENLVKKLITSYVGNAFPAPSPSRAFQRAIDKGMEVEHWSMLSIMLRLLAGAMDVKFIPTKSMIGSTMEKELKEDFLVIEDPFGSGEKVGLIKAVKPDLSILHAFCADPNGNTIISGLPIGERAYGAYASKNGAIVTVEKIVSTDFIRKNASIVDIPGHLVKAVCETPFGTHPNGTVNPDGSSYYQDIPFNIESNKATRKEETMKQWIKEWVYDVGDFQGYLNKLGTERLMLLEGRGQPDSWKWVLPDTLRNTPKFDKFTEEEQAIVVASRELVKTMKKSGYRILLAGIGIANLAAWLAVYNLRTEKIHIDLLVEWGMFGYLPKPTDPVIFTTANIPTCKMITDIIGSIGINVNYPKSMAILSAGQVDKYGNINSTRIDGLALVGSGGSNDVVARVKEAMIIMVQDKTRLVEKVPYITCPGEKVNKIITPQAIFEKENGTMVLKKYFPRQGFSESETIQKIGENTGWKIELADALDKIEPPTEQELSLLRIFDPERFFLGSLSKTQ
jgi:acyl CoA:acetate/3-ketoacid CoA transferase alpha subunit/acyl CoA:acetate/3-ketoacid CoA transferase beta subunit